MTTIKELEFIKFTDTLSRELNITPEQLEQAIRQAMINQCLSAVEFWLNDKRVFNGEVKDHFSNWRNAGDINKVSKRRRL